MKFPDPEQTGPDGLIAVGGDLSPKTLELAYTQGIFPWPQPDVPLLWFSPTQRGVLFFDQFKVPKSVRKQVEKNEFTVTFNQSFSQVIHHCSRIPRNHETGTWILPEMVEAYIQLHQQGLAISVEAWWQGDLVGGLYGVLFKGVFSGESMFFKVSGASKVCLVHLVEDLKQKGHQWIDIQMVTPVLEQFGGKYISRKKFLNLLKEKHAKNT